MNILNALKKEIFVLPKNSNNIFFPVFLEECFSEFLHIVEKIDEGTIVGPINENKEKLKNLCAVLIKSTKTYYNGFPSKAYYEFEEGISFIEDFLFPYPSPALVYNELEPYYRARIGKDKQFERKEMFHIPFENREYVTTQRFSIPGLPCLYLSNSTYVCWEELRRPNIHKMQVSRYKLENYKLKFLDLSLTPSSICQMLELSLVDTMKDIKGNDVPITKIGLDSWDKVTLNYIMRWPLIAACSIKVTKEGGTFKPEYIFPQFLLQWVTHNKQIDGIKYFSIEANASAKINHSQLINFVIPPKEINPTGYCKSLVDSFSLTEAISWEFLTITNPDIVQYNQEKLKNNIRKLGINNWLSQLELIKDKKMYYWRTIFGKIELEFIDMEFKKIIS
jgi:hypothetical protein